MRLNEPVQLGTPGSSRFKGTKTGILIQVSGSELLALAPITIEAQDWRGNRCLQLGIRSRLRSLYIIPSKRSMGQIHSECLIAAKVWEPSPPKYQEPSIVWYIWTM